MGICFFPSSAIFSPTEPHDLVGAHHVAGERDDDQTDSVPARRVRVGPDCRSKEVVVADRSDDLFSGSGDRDHIDDTLLGVERKPAMVSARSGSDSGSLGLGR
jgi:hypothetical protein